MYRKSSAKLQGMSSYQDDDHYYVPGLKEVVSSICGRNQEWSVIKAVIWIL